MLDRRPGSLRVQCSSFAVPRTAIFWSEISGVVPGIPFWWLLPWVCWLLLLPDVDRCHSDTCWLRLHLELYIYKICHNAEIFDCHNFIAVHILYSRVKKIALGAVGSQTTCVGFSFYRMNFCSWSVTLQFPQNTPSLLSQHWEAKIHDEEDLPPTPLTDIFKTITLSLPTHHEGSSMGWVTWCLGWMSYRDLSKLSWRCDNW